MDSNRHSAIVVGVLYIIGTASGVVSLLLAGPILGSADILTRLQGDQYRFVAGTLMLLVMGFALALVPAVLFPLLRRYSEVLAVGAVIFRGALETGTYVAQAAVWLQMVSVSAQAAKAGADPAIYRGLGSALAAADHVISSQITPVVFSLGALIVYYAFYRTRLIPRWLSVWGLAGAVFFLVVPLVGMFGVSVEILFAPLAVQEMVMAVWLIAKGFDTSALPASPA
jgi:hypothetical protein